MDGKEELETTVLPVDAGKIGKVAAVPSQDDILDDLDIKLDEKSRDATNLRFAAEQLKHSDIPVAFPTETVYGLGADATRSAAVNGIYRAKQRPADNPLIVHFGSLKQLRDLLRPSAPRRDTQTNGHVTDGDTKDPIPDIYRPLIEKFWPGPLTIILPNPPNSPLAPEVTAGLSTFGARMPRHVLAQALIRLADVPIAAPSANASTKPSPTAAEHVLYDLDGRIETIVDGGPCDVGVESTVVDGLCDPPLILRPGGISIDQLRSCSGWEKTQIGYKNASESGSKPKAPGMKYRHYSPKALVVLYEAGKLPPTMEDLLAYSPNGGRLGVITTRQWSISTTATNNPIRQRAGAEDKCRSSSTNEDFSGFAGMLKTLRPSLESKNALQPHRVSHSGGIMQLLQIALGSDTANIARGIFSALRELDRGNVTAIFVEGIDDLEGDTAAAVMNRLRKAAEIEVG